LEIVGIALVSKAHGLICQTPEPTAWLIVAAEEEMYTCIPRNPLEEVLMPTLAAVVLP
jgi:hypothetical protein